MSPSAGRFACGGAIPGAALCYPPSSQFLVQIIVITWIVPHARAAVVGHVLDRPRMRELLELLWLVWPIAIVGMIIVQTIAMRWMLRRARGADFKLIVSPMDGSST